MALPATMPSKPMVWCRMKTGPIFSAAWVPGGAFPGWHGVSAQQIPCRCQRGGNLAAGRDRTAAAGVAPGRDQSSVCGDRAGRQKTGSGLPQPQWICRTPVAVYPLHGPSGGGRKCPGLFPVPRRVRKISMPDLRLLVSGLETGK